ncbi:MAG: hypothetical protein RLZZ244_395 [Verrucomicrobiota bacterium]
MITIHSPQQPASPGPEPGPGGVGASPVPSPGPGGGRAPAPAKAGGEEGARRGEGRDESVWLFLAFNAFLVFSLLDGGLWFAKTFVVRLPWLFAWVASLKGLVALGSSLLTLVVIALISSYRGLPWGWLVPTLAVSVWAGLWYLPLPGLLAWPNVEFVGAVAALGAGIWTVLRLRKRLGYHGFPRGAFAGCHFSWGRTGWSTLAHVFGLLPAAVVYLAVSGSVMVERISAGFVQLRLSGLYVEARTYQREGRKVLLLPTAHIAAPDFYANLVREVPKRGSVLLPEGVTDHRTILGTRVTYSGPAKAMGVVEQPDFEHTLPSEVRSVDADLSDFAPATQMFLKRVFRGFQRWSEGDGAGAAEIFLDLPAPDLAQLREDILSKRNARVVEGILREVEHFECVVVPWGAAHMPGIEQRLLASAFQRTGFREVRVVPWSLFFSRGVSAP